MFKFAWEAITMDSTYGKIVKGIVQGALVFICCASLLACAYSLKTAPGASISGLSLESLTRDQYVVLGRTTGSSSFTYILFLRFPAECKKGLLVTSPVTPAPTGFLNRLFNLIPEPGSRELDAAAYEALSLAPEADAILPLRTSYKRTGFWPIFWKTEGTVYGKAIRIKIDAELRR
jgi:hypothetical protein